MKNSTLESQGYHVHIYYELDLIEKAAELREKMINELPLIEGVGPLRKQAVGPHPIPMFEAWFRNEQLDPILRWLMFNRGSFVVMFHPLSGNDYDDHAAHCFWLGKSLKLNLDIF